VSALRPFGSVLTLALALVTPARAQEAAESDTLPASTWRLGLSVDGSWYENPSFVTVDQRASTWSASGHATLTNTRRFRTGSFSLSGFGGMLYYPEIDDFSQPTYGGSLKLGVASRHTQFSLGQSYSRSNTRNLWELDAEGLPLPTADLQNATTSLGLRHRLSQHWQFGLAGGFTWRSYTDERLTGGEQLSGSAQLGHTFGKASSLYLAYGYTASWFDAGVTRAHQGLLGVRKAVDKGVSLELAGGVGYLESTRSLYPAAHASLSAAGRRASFTLAYKRDFGQAFGYGRQTIADVASARFAWTATRKLSFNAGYTFGYRRDANDESYTIQSHIASAGFGWSILKGLTFGGSYGWQRNVTRGLAVVDGQRATASLSYGVDWR